MDTKMKEALKEANRYIDRTGRLTEAVNIYSRRYGVDPKELEHLIKTKETRDFGMRWYIVETYRVPIDGGHEYGRSYSVQSADCAADIEHKPPLLEYYRLTRQNVYRYQRVIGGPYKTKREAKEILREMKG